MISQQAENEAVQEDFVVIFYISKRGFVFIITWVASTAKGGLTIPTDNVTLC